MLGPNPVVELSLCVVMQEEEPQGRPVGVVGELQHRRIAIRVAGREERASADLVPDPHRLLRAVVEVIGLGLVGDGAALVVAGVGEGAAAADDPLAGDALHVLADGPHEVPTTARGHVVREFVGLH
jgi:hypothetical protein